MKQAPKAGALGRPRTGGEGGGGGQDGGHPWVIHVGHMAKPPQRCKGIVLQLKSTNELKKKIQLYHSVKPFFTLRVSNPCDRQRHELCHALGREAASQSAPAAFQRVLPPADPAAGWAPQGDRDARCAATRALRPSGREGQKTSACAGALSPAAAGGQQRVGAAAGGGGRLQAAGRGRPPGSGWK